MKIEAYTARLGSAAVAAALLALSACGGTGTPPPDNNPPPVDVPQAPPRIVSVAGEGTAEVTVTAEDVNGDDIYVTADAPAGVIVSEATKTIPDGSGSAVFQFSSASVASGAAGSVTFSVADSIAPNPETKVVNIEAPPFEYADDTLYAFAADTEIETGDVVTIVVSTGELPNALAFLTSVRLRSSSGMHYVPGSFNVGAPGGANNATDGVWDALPANWQILMVPDLFLAQGYKDEMGKIAYDFNITPIDPAASDNAGYPIEAASGDLFNFQVVFDRPGEFPLDFVATETIDRTYYQDSPGVDNVDPPHYKWADLSNSGSPAGTVTVTGEPVDVSDILDGPGDDEEPVVPLGDYDFAATARPESFTFGGSLGSLSVTYSEFDESSAEWMPEEFRAKMPDLMEAQVHVTGAQDLTALYIDLTFPSADLDFEYAWTQGTETANWIMGPPPLMYDGPDNICFFAAAPNPQDAVGFSGDGVVAKVYFHKVVDSGPSSSPEAYHSGYEPPAPAVSGTTLAWGYDLPGDFNQDGAVNIDDFLSLAYHFGATAGAEDSVTYMISAPDQASVGIGAISKIGVMFMGEFDSYNVYSGAAGSYPDGGTLLGNVPLSAGTGDALTVRRQFSYELGAAPGPGTQLWLRTVRNGTAGAASAVCTVP